jgi:hypothetical protein
MIELGKGGWLLIYQWVLAMLESTVFSGYLEDCLDIIRQPLFSLLFTRCSPMRMG